MCPPTRISWSWGSASRRDNPELRSILARGLPIMSFPAFLHTRFLAQVAECRRCGRRRKTTTTAMLAWILEQAGFRPDYLIGGMARNFPAPARLDATGLTVLEGDVVACAFDDPSPKFAITHPKLSSSPISSPTTPICIRIPRPCVPCSARSSVCCHPTAASSCRPTMMRRPARRRRRHVRFVSRVSGARGSADRRSVPDAAWLALSSRQHQVRAAARRRDERAERRSGGTSRDAFRRTSAQASAP